MGISSGLARDIIRTVATDIIGAVAGDIIGPFLGISSGRLPRISSGLLPGISSGLLPGLLSGPLPGISSHRCWGYHQAAGEIIGAVIKVVVGAVVAMQCIGPIVGKFLVHFLLTAQHQNPFMGCLWVRLT